METIGSIATVLIPSAQLIVFFWWFWCLLDAHDEPRCSICLSGQAPARIALLKQIEHVTHRLRSSWRFQGEPMRPSSLFLS